MKMMDSKKEEIAKAYAAGQLSLEDYQKALIAAHLGKRLDEMRKYYAKPVGPERAKYLDKLMAKKETKEERGSGVGGQSLISYSVKASLSIAERMLRDRVL